MAVKILVLLAILYTTDPLITGAPACVPFAVWKAFQSV